VKLRLVLVVALVVALVLVRLQVQRPAELRPAWSPLPWLWPQLPRPLRLPTPRTTP
jgi:hypothetical protein